jgi:tetratricopeptide (TPR) repeat protein
MKRFTLSLALLVIVTATVSPYAAAQSVSNSIAQVNQKPLEFNQNLIEIKPLSKPSNTRSSGEVEALIKKGFELLKAQKYKESIPYFTKALTIEPNNLEARFYRGVSYFATEEFKKSIADLDIVIKYEPKFANSYYFRGLDYAYLGDKDKAIADLETAATLYEKDGATENAKDARDIIEKLKAV